ncbi:MAG: peptidylprolyl isomerase [Defluviitaleaceae bacterium]|nr:peptidylprolyl isomerase [Defluviitaleaceae bacterium]
MEIKETDPMENEITKTEAVETELEEIEIEEETEVKETEAIETEAIETEIEEIESKEIEVEETEIPEETAENQLQESQIAPTTENDNPSSKGLVIGALVLVAIIIAMVSWLVVSNRRNTPAEIVFDDVGTPAVADYVPATTEDTNVETDLPETDSIVVATVNGIEITSDDVMFELRRAEEFLMWDYIMMFPDDAEIDFEREFRDGITFGRAVVEQAVQLAAELRILTNYAAEIGIEHSPEEIEMIASHIASLVEEYGEDELNDILSQDNVRGIGHLANIFRNQIIIDNLVMTLMMDPVEFARFQPYMEEVMPCDALERSVELLSRIQDGEDFSSLIFQYGEDPGMDQFPDGYTFIVGDMVQEFEDAVLDMEIGELSGLVTTSFGIHIIMRVEPDPDNIMPNSRFFRDGGEEELLGAKHLLIQFAQDRPEDERMIEAIVAGFQVMNEAANIVFLPALDDISVG